MIATSDLQIFSRRRHISRLHGNGIATNAGASIARWSWRRSSTMANRWEERNRDYRDDPGYDRDRDERGVISRAGDEVRSWFGDDEAARRRRMDDLRDERRDRDWNERTAGSAERGWDRMRGAVRDATDRDRDGRRGFAEWNDDDRRFGGGRAPDDRGREWRPVGTSPGRDFDYSRRERGFSDTSRYASPDPYLPVNSTRPSYETRQDWQGTGYVGRGPRGYRRGDERIREDVCDRLTDEARIDASDIEVSVANGEVTLSGSVRTREEKRFTEDVIERVSGVREVNNSLKVRPPDEVLGTARSGASVLGLTETPPPSPSKEK
jgi:osmotically-inducible protein OsmY